MENENTISRRGLLMKVGTTFNALVAAALAVPVVRFVLSSVTRGRASGYLSWVPLGRVSEFPEGETRLGIEGYEASKWVVQDYGDVVVHVFNPDTRLYYSLEDLWADAPRVDWEQV